MDDLDNSALVQLLLAGEASAARAFVLRFRHTVMRVLHGFHQFSHADCEDLFQETFFRLFANDCAVLQGWRQTGTLGGYIATIACRLAIDHLRKRHGDDLVEPLEDPDALVGDAADPETLALINQLRRVMHTAIQQLGPPHTEVLNAVDIEGLSYVEAGTRLGRTANHIGVQLNVARARLRALVGREYPALLARAEFMD